GGILTFTYSKGALNALNLRLSAFERIGKIKNLAKPTVITINGQEATIKQGQEIPYQTAVIAGGAATPNIQFKEAVLELKVLPIISPDGRILLDIKLKQDTPGVQTPRGPAINTKEVTTKVIVNDGDTVVIGGIIDTQNNRTNEGVAGLVRVPILKWLFGQESVSIRDVELLIFITPSILME
ncbi:MAG TPA: pilus assembly protein, partial [Aquifex aeolicus]|nr:pilus assembly protein [Aquifex aeolicus]